MHPVVDQRLERFPFATAARLEPGTEGMGMLALGTGAVDPEEMCGFFEIELRPARPDGLDEALEARCLCL